MSDYDDLTADLEQPRDHIDADLARAQKFVLRAIDEGCASPDWDALLKEALLEIRDAQVHNRLLNT